MSLDHIYDVWRSTNGDKSCKIYMKKHVETTLVDIAYPIERCESAIIGQ